MAADGCFGPWDTKGPGIGLVRARSHAFLFDDDVQVVVVRCPIALSAEPVSF